MINLVTITGSNQRVKDMINNNIKTTIISIISIIKVVTNILLRDSKLQFQATSQILKHKFHKKQLNQKVPQLINNKLQLQVNNTIMITLNTMLIKLTTNSTMHNNQAQLQWIPLIINSIMVPMLSNSRPMSLEKVRNNNLYQQ